MLSFQFGQGSSKGIGFVCTNPLDEVHQCGLPAADIGSLIQRINHEPSNEFIATMHRPITVCSIIAKLDNQVLFR